MDTAGVTQGTINLAIFIFLIDLQCLRAQRLNKKLFPTHQPTGCKAELCKYEHWEIVKKSETLLYLWYTKLSVESIKDQSWQGIWMLFLTRYYFIYFHICTDVYLF